MSLTLFRYVLRTYLQFFIGIFAATLVIFVVADFVDRAKVYQGDHWLRDVSLLYANKVLLAVQQLGPAALLLAAGATVSSLRKRGEVTALRSLTLGPSALYVPIALFALLACAGLVAFDEWVVTRAGHRVDVLTAKSFSRRGDWRFREAPKQWFRIGDKIFYLRAGEGAGSFGSTTILTVTDDFQLTRRVDADSMRSVEGTTWVLENVVERIFPVEGGTRVLTERMKLYDLGVPGTAFRIQPGRPEQMRLSELKDQLEARREVGLATQLFALALHNRFAYPLAGFPAALLAVGLALRPQRRGHLTAAILEGLLVSVGMWGLMVVCKTLVLTDRLSAAWAAWVPTFLLVVAAGWLWLVREGRAGWVPRLRRA